MNLSFKNNLIGLPVETKLGLSVGKISDIELEAEGHRVSSYLVKTSKVLPGFLSRELAINPRQVVSLTDEKMVVDDNVVKEPVAGWAKMPATNMGMEGGQLAVDEE